MKRFYIIVSILFFASACLNESSVDPAVTSTFVRYFNGGNNDKAYDFELTSDAGFIILATTEIPSSDPSKDPTYRIKLIKTDFQGSVTWQGYFPDVPAEGDVSFHGSYQGSSIEVLSDGSYVISGQSLNYNPAGLIASSEALIVRVDAAGKVTNSATYSFANKGHAVTINVAGNFLLLGSSGIPGDYTMYLSEIKSSDLTEIDRSPGFHTEQEPNTNHIYIDPTGKAIWTNTDTSSGGAQKAIRMTALNSASDPNPYFVAYNNNPPYEETAIDVCRFGENFASVGSTNWKKDASGNLTLGGDRDIMFVFYDQLGKPIVSLGFPMIDPAENKSIDGLNDGQDDTGNAIYPTQDSGLILLGTVDSKGVAGRGDTDYVLIKINSATPDAHEEWRTHFGSRYKDTGVAIRQIASGNFVILGNTSQGGLDMIMLAQTDKYGKIQ